ncbi:MAG TPA: TonB-dependent receptor [Polyangiaceae bacterium]|nr:TonB-dependent receptor [Polyangiaceae bacterium]
MRFAPPRPVARLAACALLAHGAAHAEPEPEPQTVVVRARAQPASASDTVLDRRALEATPHRNGSELLREVPGVFVTQHGGEGKAQQLFFRGFDAEHGQDLEIWAGGAPVNEVSNIHGQGYADLYFLIPEVVEEIHSQPGTYDPRQGDFAVAGSLDFRLGMSEPGMTLAASAGNFGTRRYLLAYHPKDADSQTFGAFELYSTDGFGPSRAAQRASAIGQLAHDFGGGVRGRVLATAYSGHFDAPGVLRLDDIEAGRVDRFDTYDSKQGGSSSRSSLVLELARERDPENPNGAGAPDGWSIAPYLVLRSLHLRSNFTGYLVHPTTGDSIQQMNEATTVGARAAYHRTLALVSSHDTLEVGIMLRSDWIRQNQHWLSLLDDSITDSAAHPGVAATIRATDATGYFSAALQLLRRLSLRGGLRGDGLFDQTEDTGGGASGQVRSAQGAQLSKRATLDWAAFHGFHALASYGDGFRSPQARSLADGETTPFTRVASIEAGVRYADRQRVSASAAVYHTRLSDDLVFDQGTARNELVPSTARTGFAATLAARPTPWLLSSTSLTTARAVFTASGAGYTEGDLLPYVPELVVQADVAVTPELGRLGAHPVTSKLGAVLTYLGRRPLPYAEMGHDVLTVDTTLALRWGPVAARLDVYNLLDAEYYDGEFVYASSWNGASSLVPSRHVTVGAPRSWLFTLGLFI